MPLAHGVHDAWPGAVVTEPIGHDGGSVVPGGQYAPAGHNRQLSIPLVLVYVPAAHVVHADAPCTLLALPGSQAVHGPAPGDCLYEPAAHSAQVDAPSYVFDAPMAHVVHGVGLETGLQTHPLPSANPRSRALRVYSGT